MPQPSSSDLQRAYHLVQQGRFADALPILKVAAPAKNGDLAFQKAIADACFYQNDFAAAAHHLGIAAGLSRDKDLDVLEKLAFAIHKAGRVEESLGHFAKAYQTGLRTPRFLKGYAAALEVHVRALEKSARFADVVPSLRTLTQTFADDPYLMRGLAGALNAEGAISEAVRIGERAYELEPSKTTGLLAELLIAAGRPFDVFRLLAPFDAFALQEPVATINRNLSKALSGLESDEVVQRLSDLCAANPTARSIPLQLALAALRAGRVDLARDAVAKLGPEAHDKDIYVELKARLELITGDAAGAAALLCRIWDRAAGEFRKTAATRQGPAAAARPLVRDVHPIAYMPIEITQRELAPRILTACYLAAHGLGSVLMAAANYRQCGSMLPPGVVLNKTLNSLDHATVARNAAQGHLFAALDEEAMAWMGSDAELLCGVDARIVDLIDLVMVPGQRHRDAFASVFPTYGHRVHVTGNPRLDLITRDMDTALTARLRERHGDFVLVCTNFAATNSSLFGFARACNVFLDVTSGAQGDLSFEQIVEMGKSSAVSECAYFRLLAETLPPAARAFPDLTFVVRAHPGESDGIWRMLFRHLPNVRVDSSGPLQDWLPATRALVHMSGCATGLEAHLAGVPALRLTSSPEMAFPKYGLSHRLNMPVHDSDEMIFALKRVLEGERAPLADEMRAFIAYHISQTEEPAARRMADAIADLYRRAAETGRVLNGSVVDRLQSVARTGAELAAREARRVALAASKRVTFDVGEVRKLCASMKQVFDIQSIDVVALSDDALLLGPASMKA